MSHLMVKAGAGTGKTFTITNGVHLQCHRPMPTRDGKPIKGSEEQQVIWDAMCSDSYPGNIHMTSFTTDASDQLEDKCPVGFDGKSMVTSSSTCSMGLRFAKRAGQAKYVDRFKAKYKTLTTEYLGMTKFESKDKLPGVWDAIFELQEKARLNLKVKMTKEEVTELADHFAVEVSPRSLEQVTDGINQVLAAGREKAGQYDFTDMLYIPVVTGLVRKTYGTLVVDEFQDMGRAQQELCLQAGWKLILIGDPHQAIYGFAGADQSAFERLEKFLGMTAIGVKTFPLNMTRRCAQDIVTEANKFVPELRALPDAPRGEVKKIGKGEMRDYFNEIEHGYGAHFHPGADWQIICPTNAPLIGLMFDMQRRGIKSFVHGKDITDSMQKFVNTFDGAIGELRYAIADKLDKIQSRKISKTSEAQLDIYLALEKLAAECHTVSAVSDSIGNMFSDEPRPGWLRMSSIHRSKGLEADTIVIWNIDKCKSRYSVRPWQHLQDRNLEYVGITRSKTRLIMVRSQ